MNQIQLRKDIIGPLHKEGFDTSLWSVAQPGEDWEVEYSNTQLCTQGGSCWECCEYEEMVDNMRDFIRNQISQTKLLMAKEIVDRIKKTKELMQSAYGTHKYDSCYDDCIELVAGYINK